MEASHTVPGMPGRHAISESAPLPAPAVTIPGDVAQLAREATYEIAALMQALAEHYGQVTSEDQRPLVVRGMALRAYKLTGQVMGILDTPDLYAKGGELSRLRQTLMGRAAGTLEGEE